MIVDRALVSAALPGYDLGAELGRGGFGLVLGARHVVLDRAVAVKILSDSGDSEHDVSARFRSEARVLAALDHPHIVRVYDYLERSGLHMIIMEQLPAGSLRTRIAAGISPEASAAVGLAMAEALHCAHRSGVLHRDVKAANVLFAADGTLKVTDFGIAKIFEGTETTASIIAGTPTNMAPEQLTGGRLGASTDVYALATVVFEMLAGHPVFGAGQSAAAVMRSHLEVLPQAPPSVPGPIADVLGHALAKDPAARPPSARAFALELADAASASFGPGWAARAALPLRVDDEVREAATPSGGFSTDALAGPTMAVGSRPVTIAGPRDGAPRASTLPYTRVGGRPESTPTTTTTSSSSAAAGLADLGTSYAPTGPAGTGDAGAVDAAAGPAGRARHGGGRAPARSWVRRPRVLTGLAVVVIALAVALALLLSGGGQSAKAAYAGKAVSVPVTGPTGIAIGPDGVLYVATTSDGQPFEIGTDGQVAAVTTRRLVGKSSAGIAAAANGDVYVADSDGAVIRRIAHGNGAVTVVAGSGTTGFSGDGAAATRARLDGPAGLALDHAGNLYIADSENNRVRRVDRHGTITTVAGTGQSTGGSADDVGNGGAATSAVVYDPVGVAVDRRGDLFVAEGYGHRVRKIGPDGLISTIAGTGGAPDSSAVVADSGRATRTALGTLTAVAVDNAGSVYVADQTTYRVWRIETTGNIRTVVKSNGLSTTQPTFIYEPDSLALDASGALYIGDDYTDTVRRISATGARSTVVTDAS